MHETVSQESFPRGVLLGAALLLGFALLASGLGHRLHINATPLPPARVVTALHLSFRDRSDGGVEILDAMQGNKVVQVLAPGTNGFVRGVLRGLARARRADGVGPLPPFTLTRWSDGRLTMDDPQTGQHLNLEVFGPTNSRPFAALFANRQGGTP
jgi:putative photosynthetic complex assembly protein